jgi:hypothetical protein
MKAWKVYIGSKWIDTVFFMPNCDAEYVRKSLINHDGYDSRIRVAL